VKSRSKVNINVNFILEQFMKPQRRSRDLLYLCSFFKLGAGCGGWSTLTPGQFAPRKGDTVLILQEAERAPRPVWTGTEKLVSTGIRYADRPARSESLNQLRYPCPKILYEI
jgi:hypothetical protein